MSQHLWAVIGGHLTTHCVRPAMALVLFALIAIVAVETRTFADEEPAQKTRQQKLAEARAAEKAEEKPKPVARKTLPAEPAVAVPAPVAAGAPPAEDALQQQWMQQFRPLLMTELNFIRQTCDLTPEQRPTIRAAGETSLRESIKPFAKVQQAGGGQVIINGRVKNTQPEVQTAIRKALDQALRDVLTPEQMAEYEQELAERKAQRKRAAILCVVARLDGVLFLSQDQRDKITAEIDRQWIVEWEQWSTLSNYDQIYIPQVPDVCVAPHLDDRQKIMWRGLVKIQVGGIHRGVQIADDDGWWGGAPAKPAAGAPKANNDILRPLKQLFGIGN